MAIWQRRNKDLVEKHLSHKWSELPEICNHCSDWDIVGEERFDEYGVPVVKSYDSHEKMLKHSINFKNT